jgi:hypothetical protein
VSDLIQAVQAKTDIIRVRVITRYCEMEGDLHCPRVGRKERTLSALLNNRESGFLALTNVRVTRADGREEGPHAFLQVSLQAVEYIQPFPAFPNEMGPEMEAD